MSEIKLLPKKVSDRIAAGEVVERPASVVKELIENSIDAGSSAVSISITGGGIKSITVADNGKGIAAEDVSLAFQKHATSKISDERDLEFVSTQGFRGEALSSIAAVSVVDMKTKRIDEETGSHIKISGGRIDYNNPEGLPDGTSVTVSSLFFNVPARLKFLKRESSEAAYVSDLISRYIIAYPEISFHYTSDGKTIYHSSGNGDLKAALYCVYGGNIMDTIEYIEYSASNIKVSGYVSRPGTVMRGKGQGSFFVNRRYVRNTALFEMVRNAYGETLVKGESPFFALNIELPFSAVDVNVHPNKLQVRFRDSASLEHVINEAVSPACRKVRGGIPEQTFKCSDKLSVEMKPVQGVQAEFFSGFSHSVLKEIEASTYSNPYSQEAVAYEETYPERPESDIAGSEPAAVKVEAYRLIGSLSSTYALVEQGGDLLIVDQHAAHERILYNKFKNSKEAISQELLEPIVVTVSHEQKNIIDKNMEVLASAGFGLQPFGALEYKVDAVPSIAYMVSPEELLYDALNELGGGDFVLKREKIIMSACRCAIKAGDKLSDRELKSIIDIFLVDGTVPTCPHGRPVISVITNKQIEKSFKRTI